MVIKTKFNIGQEIWISFPGFPARIIAYSVEESGNIEAKIEWWDDRARNTAWLSEKRLTKKGNKNEKSINLSNHG